MRLLIAIPCADTVRYEFADSLAKLLVHLNELGVDYDVRFLAGSLIYDARNELTVTAMDGGFSHVLWLDSDMIFPACNFDILYAVKQPFVTAIYRSRRSPYALCLFAKTRTAQRVLTLPDEVFEVEACGFGMVLMQTSVLKEVWGKYGTCFRPSEDAGEDIAMCNRYRDMGGKIYAVPDARCSHIAYVELRCDDPQKLVDYKEKR